MADKLPVYTAVYHDRYNDRMIVWYADGSRKAYSVKHRSYTPIQGQYGSLPSNMVDIFGKPLYEIITTGEEELEIRMQNKGENNKISECDIDFRTRWLENHYKDQEELIPNVADFNICFLDIEVSATDRFPSATVADYPVNCVTVYFSKPKKYYTFGLNRDIESDLIEKLNKHNCTYIKCPTERELLVNLFTTISINNADFLTGWNASFFDFPYLINRAAKQKPVVDIKLLSRLPEQYKNAYVNKNDGKFYIGGTTVTDFLLLYKKFTLKEQDDFKLDTIGFLETGEKKAPLPDGYKSHIKHWNQWVWYNFKDTELMVNIEKNCKMFDTTINACVEARVPFEAIFETKKIEVGFILNYLHRNGIAMPPLKERPRQSFKGAYVYAKPGYYTNLVSYDYGSMYPSFIMGANTSPETKVLLMKGEYFDANFNKLSNIDPSTLVRSPLKVYDIYGEDTSKIKYEVFYRTDKVGIIPKVTEKIANGRKMYKKIQQEYERDGKYDLASIYEMKQKTYKIYNNGLYGLLGNPYFQFYDLDNSGTITAFGVELIKYTIKHLCEYLEGNFKTDERYIKAFGTPPNIDASLEGTFMALDSEGTLATYYNRLSHGDTDSFFVKYQDIYSPFIPKVDKEVEIVVIKDNEIIYKKNYDLQNKEKESKIDFNNKCKEHCSLWEKLSNDDKVKAFKNGMFREKTYRIIYNRFSLTDFCRILDAVLMENVLADIMDKFAKKWNFMKNTLTVKREKCIPQCIVTAMKKYICNVESNEDIKIYDKDKRFKVTGLEIVRSSTTPFARKFVLNCVKELLNTMDKKHIREKYLDIKTEFFQLAEQGKVYDLSIPSGVKTEPPDYEDILKMPADVKKKIDWRIRGSSAWNYLIRTDEKLKMEMNEPIHAGSKVKFLKIAHNQFGLNTIAFIGTECPSRILEKFNVNWPDQWETGFANVMNRLFNAIGWGEIEYDERDTMMNIL